MTRIAYFADDAWAVPALDRLCATPGVEVVLVVERSRPSSTAIAEAAARHGLPLVRPDNVNGPEFRADYVGHGIDLAVVHAYDQIFRAPFIDGHPDGMINLHTALLPRYRGRNPLTWALIASEPVVGVTAHYIDTGIDTGDILHQVAVPVGPDDTFGVVRRRIGPAAASAAAEAVRLLLEGTASDVAIPQGQLGPGFYCSRRGPGDEYINWHAPADSIHNLVRALAPPGGPGARTTDADGRAWLIQRTEHLARTSPHAGCPGRVLAADVASAVIKTGDTAIRVISAALARNDPSSRGAAPPWRPALRFVGGLPHNES